MPVHEDGGVSRDGRTRKTLVGHRGSTPIAEDRQSKDMRMVTIIRTASFERLAASSEISTTKKAS